MLQLTPSLTRGGDDEASSFVTFVWRRAGSCFAKTLMSSCGFFAIGWTSVEGFAGFDNLLSLQPCHVTNRLIDVKDG